MTYDSSAWMQFDVMMKSAAEPEYMKHLWGILGKHVTLYFIYSVVLHNVFKTVWFNSNCMKDQTKFFFVGC